jgi:hypothetical protein
MESPVRLAYHGGLQDWHNRGVDGVLPPMQPGAELAPKSPEQDDTTPVAVRSNLNPAPLVMHVAVERLAQ